MAGNKNWVDGDVPTAAELNGYFRDQVITVCTSGTRPGSPINGRTIYETDTDSYVVYDGAAWIYTLFHGQWGTWTSTWGATGSAPSLGNGTQAGRLLIEGRKMTGHLYLAWGSTTTGGTGKWTFTLPAFITSGSAQLSSSIGGYAYDASADYAYPVAAIIGASTATIEVYAGQPVTLNQPFTWTTNDRLTLDFVIEVSF